MPKFIDGEALRSKVYHEAFETDTDMMKWDSGCWIRYRLFEKCLNTMPEADVVQVTRCKNCQYMDVLNPEVESKKKYFCGRSWIRNEVRPNGYCSEGEPREEGGSD